LGLFKPQPGGPLCDLIIQAFLGLDKHTEQKWTTRQGLKSHCSYKEQKNLNSTAVSDKTKICIMGKNIYPYPYGFTLIELVVVIVVVGILSALGGLIITNHMEGYVDVSNRAKLVDSAQSALLRMERDIRAALPNSIVVGTDGDKVTFLHTVAGGRYRTKCPASSSDCSHNQTLEINQVDDRFSMIGRLRTNRSGEIPSNVQNGQLVFSNLGNSQADVYSHDNNASIIGITAMAGSSVGINASSNFTMSSRNFSNIFQYNSSRFQIVDSQVCYSWEDGKLLRYKNSTTISNRGNVNDCKEWGTGSLIARHVDNVNFEYEPGTDTRSALLTMNATLSKNGETITLLHQVHVLNTP